MLRLAAQPVRWIPRGTEGLAHHPGGGLSIQDPIDHLRDELRALRLNRKVVSRHVGLPALMAIAGRTTASRGKW
jgi:hypothetical protein